MILLLSLARGVGQHREGSVGAGFDELLGAGDRERRQRADRRVKGVALSDALELGSRALAEVGRAGVEAEERLADHDAHAFRELGRVALENRTSDVVDEGQAALFISVPMLMGRSRLVVQALTTSSSLACLRVASSGFFRFQLRSGMMFSAAQPLSVIRSSKSIALRLAAAGAVEPGDGRDRAAAATQRVKSPASGKVFSSGWM